MNANIESREFQVIEVTDHNGAGGANFEQRVVLTFGDKRYEAYCSRANAPTVGGPLRVTYVEGELDFAFEGLFNVRQLPAA